jgi:hypothetical protein
LKQKVLGTCSRNVKEHYVALYIDAGKEQVPGTWRTLCSRWAYCASHTRQETRKLLAEDSMGLCLVQVSDLSRAIKRREEKLRDKAP